MSRANRHRHLIASAALAVLAAACVAVGLAVRDPSGITETNCGRIRPGMDRAEVEALMGGRSTLRARTLTTPDGADASGTAEVWQDAGGSVRVTFDPGGRVTDAFFVESQDASLWRRLRHK